MATERMRKRLDDSHGNSSTNINENFCLIGTPLPSLDSKKRDANEFKPIWQQEVYDDQGRRRFHGAFTGGYSAGYYNSVGSKEGWQPSTFRSSRKDKERSQKDGQQKTKYQQSTAEDFMDEEDLESFGNGRGTLKANEDFRLQHSKSDSHHDPLMGILRLQDEHNRKPEGSSESNIFINKSSLGTKILQRMGWKPGQGLGAWLPLDGLRRLRLLVGLPTKRDEGVASSSNLYPPPDTDMVMPPSNHTGAQGLGCNDTATPSNLAQLLERRHESNREQSISSRPQGGFGIGALEEDSDDEAEVYSTGHRMQDSTLDSKTKSIKRGRIERKEKPGSVHKISSDDNDKRGHWHDKSPMIPGFVLSDDVMEEKNNDIENILVPDAWQPDPNRVWKDTSSGLTRTKTGFIPPTSSSQRASSFGEAKIPGPPPSIADYLSIKDRERLEKAKAAAMQTGSLENVTFRDTKPAIPKIEPEIAKAALQGYIPFENDKEKQNRYRIYLQAQMNQDQTLKPVSGQRIDEFERELREFSRSAAIFKPMNTMMSSRFETALTSDQSGLQKMKPGLFLPSNVPASFKEKSFPSSEEDKDQKSVPDNLTSLQRNAKMGLFGPHTTRETKKWIPARLLCKRFNVPHPYPDEMANEDVLSKGRSSESFDEFGHSKGERKEDKMSVNARWEASKRQLQELAANHARKKPSKEEYHDKEERSSQLAQENSPTRNHDSNRKEDTFDLSSVGLGEVKGDIYESDYTKPSIDLFKSIFAQEERLPSNDELAKSDLDSTEQGTTQEMPSKLLFKPRKRSSTEDVDDSQSESIGNRKKKSDKIRSSKNQIRGSLTFNMEEEEEEEEFEFQPKKLRKTKQ